MIMLYISRDPEQKLLKSYKYKFICAVNEGFRKGQRNHGNAYLM